MNSSEEHTEQQSVEVQEPVPANEINHEADKENLEVNKQEEQSPTKENTGKKKSKKDKKKKQEQKTEEETKEPEKVEKDNFQITQEQLASEGIEGEILRPDENGDVGNDEEDGFGYNEDEYKGMDRVNIPKYEKELGGKAFAAGKYEEATKHYSKAILGTNFLFKDGMVETEEQARELLTEVQIPCYLNNALCFIKLENWRLAFENASAALKMDEENTKALYRKALASVNLGDLTTASECLKKALEVAPNDQNIRNLAIEVRDKRKQIYEKEKKMGQKMVQEMTEKKEEEEKVKESVPKPQIEQTEFLGSTQLGKLKRKIVEPIEKKQQDIVHQVQTWRDQLKLLILLPLSLLSETCCRRRLPSQFYQVKNSKKEKEN